MEAYPEDIDPKLIGELKLFHSSVKIAYLDKAALASPTSVKSPRPTRKKNNNKDKVQLAFPNVVERGYFWLWVRSAVVL